MFVVSTQPFSDSGNPVCLHSILKLFFTVLTSGLFFLNHDSEVSNSIAGFNVMFHELNYDDI